MNRAVSSTALATSRPRNCFPRSLPFPGALLVFPGVLAVVEEDGPEEILVGVRRLPGEDPGEITVGLLSSSGSIDLRSPNIEELVALLRGHWSWLADDHPGSPPLTSLRGKDV